MHPQQMPGRPDRLRWVMSGDVLTGRGTGPLADVPAPLAALLADGTLAQITLDGEAVITCLGAERNWSEEGARVRSALYAALDDPAGWITVDGTSSCDDDEQLHGVAREVLAGEVGDFVRSHGGSIELVGVRDGIVTVRLGGACHGCPASWFTLHQRLERRLRQRHPGLREVRNAASPGGLFGRAPASHEGTS
ncbi:MULTISPECIES: NifU family protein [unclassified Streptomyces]|uniref:NifU family protein n=1 Tax=unclassified Streptomyces TaxID=2593676 RepID=UPI001C1F4887|nr:MULTISPECIES: NifU family protein [unclassified Streptomyces]